MRGLDELVCGRLEVSLPYLLIKPRKTDERAGAGRGGGSGEDGVDGGEAAEGALLEAGVGSEVHSNKDGHGALAPFTSEFAEGVGQ